MKLLFIGDIVGVPGCQYVREVLPGLLRAFNPDLVVANAENAANGKGLTRKAAEQLFDAGVEILTLGNHAWDHKDIFTFIDEDRRIIRPANYPEGTPGSGYTVCTVRSRPVLIVNLMGRTFMQSLDCPFREVDRILALHPHIHHIVVDMHAETTSEKLAMGWYLDGRASLVVGTHTHVPTADERVLPGGTAYITDVGMVGPSDGILGIDRETVIRRFITQLPSKFAVANGPRQFCAVLVELDDATGRARSIERVYIAEQTPAPGVQARRRDRDVSSSLQE
ncbi:metallophosphoesterase [Alicyclobacillus cellulosilyticus]|uniref:Metallophosphoesterase n=1 Tax=Alicyclobacillus cellulosilyticus TaxID=1003997 RepID=A0A917K9R8_9BACL|nr:TIGR00282 family metallophosphoesterase [Alicyclobacillus cellulosilyticus]GGJ04493.1 metallophosphoesterase [Alicyclobacillus cellulosilyticus]